MNVQSECSQDAQNGPESGATPVSDVPVMQHDTTPSGAEIERHRITRDCVHMMQTLVVRLETGDDATRARVQRRLASLVTDTQPEVQP